MLLTDAYMCLLAFTPAALQATAAPKSVLDNLRSVPHVYICMSCGKQLYHDTSPLHLCLLGNMTALRQGQQAEI